jgi:hypothetical protein
MKIDENKPAVAQTTCEEDRQNRREFFNGLGKWSMAVVAAISFLRGSGPAAQAGHEETPRPEQEPERPAWTVSDDARDKRLKLADYSKGGGYDKEGGGEGGGYAKGYDKFHIPHGNSNPYSRHRQ